MPTTGVERLFFTLSGVATPSYYTEAALFLLAPTLQTIDLGVWAQIAQLAPSTLLAGLLLLIWRGELLPKGTVDKALAEKDRALERVEVERSREREQFQARLDATTKHYETRLIDRDHQIAEKDKQVGTLLEAVKEGTLLVSQAAALVSNQKAA
jgi:hypothetical protein